MNWSRRFGRYGPGIPTSPPDCPRPARRIAHHWIKTPSTEKTLTFRQREVLQLLAEGRTVKEIALRLKISTRTVEFHKAQVMEQLNLRTTADLIKYALTHGVLASS